MTSGTDDDIPVEEAEDVKAVVTVSTEDEDDNELSMMSETAAAALTPTTDNENSDSSNNNNKCMIISQAEAMNPMRRTNMEDVCVIHKAGDWDCPDESMTYIGVYDGHGGEYKCLQCAHTLCLCDHTKTKRRHSHRILSAFAPIIFSPLQCSL